MVLEKASNHSKKKKPPKNSQSDVGRRFDGHEVVQAIDDQPLVVIEKPSLEDRMEELSIAAAYLARSHIVERPKASNDQNMYRLVNDGKSVKIDGPVKISDSVDGVGNDEDQLDEDPSDQRSETKVKSVLDACGIDPDTVGGASITCNRLPGHDQTGSTELPSKPIVGGNSQITVGVCMARLKNYWSAMSTKSFTLKSIDGKSTKVGHRDQHVYHQPSLQQYSSIVLEADKALTAAEANVVGAEKFMKPSSTKMTTDDDGSSLDTFQTKTVQEALQWTVSKNFFHQARIEQLSNDIKAEEEKVNVLIEKIWNHIKKCSQWDFRPQVPSSGSDFTIYELYNQLTNTSPEGIARMGRSVHDWTQLDEANAQLDNEWIYKKIYLEKLKMRDDMRRHYDSILLVLTEHLAIEHDSAPLVVNESVPMTYELIRPGAPGH